MKRLIVKSREKRGIFPVLAMFESKAGYRYRIVKHECFVGKPFTVEECMPRSNRYRSRVGFDTPEEAAHFIIDLEKL